MTGVALRCPNCGTTQSGPGECEACHEASVRFFCTNHSPGRWLESAVCPDCGARFGEARPTPRAVPPPPPRPAPAPGRPVPSAGGPRVEAPPARRPAPSPPEPPLARPSRPPRGPWLRRGPSPFDGRGAEVDGGRADEEIVRRRWPEVLRHRMGRPTPRVYDVEVRPFGARRGCGGPLLLGVLLIVLLFTMVASSGGPLLQILLQLLLSQ